MARSSHCRTGTCSSLDRSKRGSSVETAKCTQSSRPWGGGSRFKVQGSKFKAQIHGRADSKTGPRPVLRAQHVWRRRAFGADAHGKCYHAAAPGDRARSVRFASAIFLACFFVARGGCKVSFRKTERNFTPAKSFEPALPKNSRKMPTDRQCNSLARQMHYPRSHRGTLGRSQENGAR